MKALQEQREYNARILDNEHARREQERIDRAADRKDDRDERAKEAAKVESRHVKNARDAERRFWLGLIGALIVGVSAQSILAYLRPTAAPTINVTVPANQLPPPAQTSP